MPLAAGTRLGPYEILSPIGAGGMGEVYKARDTRLERTVAVKVLPPHVADRPEFRQRFEREARAIAALNHPHICTLHDIGEQDGIHFLVMEHLEGETVAARLGRGPLPVDQVLAYAIEIADALAQAHRQGVFHRDLKPGNIMLTEAGTKLLDFGLAKLRGPEAAPVVALSALPTEADGLTLKGSILGTIQYMAPEQLEGKETDGRADLFSFGAVIYEMVTGRKAFAGTSHASVIGAILHTDPAPLASLQPMTPPALERLVKACLAKRADQRRQTAQDVLLDLKWMSEASAPVPQPVPAAAPPEPARRPLAWIAATAVLAVSLATLGVFQFLQKPPETRPFKLSVLPPDNANFSFLTLSPDGRRLAFVAAGSSGRTLLWVRPLDSLAGQALAGTDGATLPFWSPDSRFLGFFADGKLKKIEVSGGPPQALCPVNNGRGGAWSRDGVIVFTPSNSAPLLQVAAAGGEPKPLTTLDRTRQESTHRHPYFLPDGRHFMYMTRSGQPENRGVFLGSLEDKPDSTTRRRLLGDDSNAVYAPPQDDGSGHLLFRRGGVLMAQPFDAQELRLAGDPFPVADKVEGGAYFRGAFAVSDTGMLVYDTRETAAEERRLVWFDRQGKQIAAVGEPGLYLHPWLSPDEKRVAAETLEAQQGTPDLWLLDLAREVPTRFTFDPGVDAYPVWSPDGSRIVWGSGRDGAFNLYQKLASGAGQEEPLLKTDDAKRPTDWSLDGRFLAYSQSDPKSKWDLWVLPLSGDRKPAVFLQTPFDEEQGHFSPDGRWIAYASNESSVQQVYVQPFPATGAKFQVSKNGGQYPKWRRDGRELFFLAPDRKLMAIDVRATGGASFEVGNPKALFQTRIEGAATRYTVTRDGQRFLVPTATVDQAASTPATVVINWAAGVKR